jgi:hypothetical protein
LCALSFTPMARYVYNMRVLGRAQEARGTSTVVLVLVLALKLKEHMKSKTEGVAEVL